MQASIGEEGVLLSRQESLVMELKYPLKIHLAQRQHPLEFFHWEVGVESFSLIEYYAACIA